MAPVASLQVQVSVGRANNEPAIVGRSAVSLDGATAGSLIAGARGKVQVAGSDAVVWLDGNYELALLVEFTVTQKGSLTLKASPRDKTRTSVAAPDFRLQKLLGITTRFQEETLNVAFRSDCSNIHSL